MFYILFIFALDGNTPGPNAYPLKSLMGANFNSKYKSNPGMSLYGRFRETTNASSKCKLIVYKVKYHSCLFRSWTWGL